MNQAAWCNRVTSFRPILSLTIALLGLPVVRPTATTRRRIASAIGKTMEMRCAAPRAARFHECSMIYRCAKRHSGRERRLRMAT